MELSEDDVLHILKLIDESKFDYFQLEVGELKITVSKGEPIPISASPQSAAISGLADSGVLSSEPIRLPRVQFGPIHCQESIQEALICSTP